MVTPENVHGESFDEVGRKRRLPALKCLGTVQVSIVQLTAKTMKACAGPQCLKDAVIKACTSKFHLATHVFSFRVRETQPPDGTPKDGSKYFSLSGTVFAP